MARSDSKKTTGMRLSDFLAEKGAAPRPIYVLRGTDPYLLAQGRRRVREQAVGDADPGLAVVEVSGADAVLADVMDSLRTLPFLAPRRLVMVREAEAFLEKPARKSETVRDVLLDYLEDPASTGSLCLEVSAWNDSTNLAKRVAEKGLLVACELKDPAILPGWLQGQATKLYKKKLSAGAAQLLIESLGTEFASLLSALDALALYVGAAEKIDVPDVDALVARGHHERVWALCDAVSERKVAKALELLDIFWTEGMAAPQIVGLLRPTLRQLLRVKALSRKMSTDAAMEKVFVNYYARDRVRKAVMAFSDDHLANAYQALVDADLEAKSTPNDRLVMETLIHRLCLPEAAHGVSAAVE